jgi:putative PIN family toxin of toxin-antitoxin system
MPTIKAVLDTSVMVSVAFAKEGLARDLRDLIAEEAFILVTSKAILVKLYRVLHHPRTLAQFQPSEEDIDEFIGLVLEKALLTPGRYSLHKISDDPTDDIFLACAMEAGADYIVSRDPHLLNLKDFHSAKIIGVKEFIDQVKVRTSGLKS